MDECPLDLIFLLGQLDHLVFWLGRGCFFSYRRNYIFLDKVKASIFVFKESPFLIAIRPYM